MFPHTCNCTYPKLMRKTIYVFMLTCFPPKFAFCQNATITGTLSDSPSKSAPVFTVIAILREKDSSLVTFSRSDKNGKFEINKLNARSYLVMITYPKYGDYVQRVALKNGEHLT